MTYELNRNIEELLIKYIIEYEERPKEELLKGFFEDYIIYNTLVYSYENNVHKYVSPNRNNIDKFYNLKILDDDKVWIVKNDTKR